MPEVKDLSKYPFVTQFFCTNVRSVISGRNSWGPESQKRILDDAINYLSSIKRGYHFLVEQGELVDVSDFDNYCYLSKIVGDEKYLPEFPERISKYIDTLKELSASLDSPNEEISDELNETSNFFKDIWQCARNETQSYLYREDPDD